VTGLPLAGDGVHIGTNYVATITGRTIKQTNAASRKTRSRIAATAVPFHLPHSEPTNDKGAAKDMREYLPTPKPPRRIEAK
jgi:hypothetical protein